MRGRLVAPWGGLFAALLSVWSCVHPVPGARDATPAARMASPVFAADRDLSGTIIISGEARVLPGVTLRIAPGARLVFTREDKDGDGWGDARLRVEGTIVAVGTPEEPIFFTSGGDGTGVRRPGDWDSILLNFSRGSELRYAVIEYSNYSLHAHFSEGRVSRCLIRKNNEGCRMGNCSFVLEENLVTANAVRGFNFRACANTVRRNEITRNGNGIFIFEKDSGSTIFGNNIYANERYDFRLDDFFRGEISLNGNWWGTAEEAAIRAKIFDSRHDPEVGTVRLAPASAPHVILGSLPFPTSRSDAELP